MIDKIIFLPYAGGSKYAYRNFIKLLPLGVKAITPELPGRGARMDESPMESLPDLINHIYDLVISETACRYTIYGHSMGSLLGFLLAKKIIANHENPPLFLTCTGCRAPSMIGQRNLNLHLMKSEDFWKAIFEYGGLPAEILENVELRNMIEKSFRADFRMIETYQHQYTPVNRPILVINGDMELISDEEVNGWYNDSSTTVVIKKLKGNHFFILGQEQRVIGEMLRFYEFLNSQTKQKI